MITISSLSKLISTINFLICFLSPSKIGIAIPSSYTICAALSTSKKSASAKTTLFGPRLARVVNFRIHLLPEPNLSANFSAYLSQSSIGFLATPEATAALATATGTTSIKRKSNGFGMI